MILRDYWFCWVSPSVAFGRSLCVLSAFIQILSIAFELAEYSLQHQLPNFAEVCFLFVFSFSIHRIPSPDFVVLVGPRESFDLDAPYERR